MTQDLVSSPTGSQAPVEGEKVADSSSLYISHYGEQTDVDAIVSTYMRLNKIFFGVGIYGIIILVLGVIGWFISLPKVDEPFPLRDETKVLQEQKLRLRVKNKNEQVFEQYEITLPIQQGIARIEDNKLISINNLLLYKGFVVPQKTQIFLSGTASTLPSIRHFMASGYTLNDIDHYVSTFIRDNYIVSPQLAPLLSSSHLLKSEYPLTKYLGLSCMQYPGATYNPLCRTLANEMLPKLAIYNLSLHYEELQSLLQRTQYTPYHQQLCASIQSYIFIANDISHKVKELMNGCGGEFESRFTEFSAFRTTQEQLSKQSIGSNVTTSALLNSYKLVSVMNEIYQEIAKTNNINEIRIGGYIDYIRSLLKNKQYIQGFYFDVIARFNNGILIPSLTQQSLTARGEIASIYRKLLVDLNELNRGNATQGYQGLQSLVSLQELMGTGTVFVVDNQEPVEVETLMQQFDRSYGFEYFIIDQKAQQDAQTIAVSGRLRFVKEVGLANNTPLSISFTLKDQRFYATKVHMPRHPSLASVLNKKLSVQPLVISELYEMIITTYVNLDKELPQEVCTVFSGEGMTCTPTKLTVIKGEHQYVFVYDAQEGIQSYSITPQSLEQQVKAEYGEKVHMTKNPVQAIALVLAFEVKKEPEPDTDTGPVGGLQEVQLQKHFEDIGATITTIDSAKQYLMVNFNLQSYNLIAVYDPQTQSILGMGIVVNGVTNPIRNFKFSFLIASQADKQLLRTDPKTYFLQFDPLLVQKLEL